MLWLDRGQCRLSSRSGRSCAISRSPSIGPERVAIVGPNGSGKTTLLKLVTAQLQPVVGHRAGQARTSRCSTRSVSLLDPAVSILDNFASLNPRADDNDCHAALARFMFRADAALQIVGEPEWRAAVFARALPACWADRRRRPLLILDEPTNHLDIDSIEAVEAGLRAYDGALLVVSHDEAFLRAIEITRRFDLAASG